MKLTLSVVAAITVLLAPCLGYVLKDNENQVLRVARQVKTRPKSAVNTKATVTTKPTTKATVKLSARLETTKPTTTDTTTIEIVMGLFEDLLNIGSNLAAALKSDSLMKGASGLLSGDLSALDPNTLVKNVDQLNKDLLPGMSDLTNSFSNLASSFPGLDSLPKLPAALPGLPNIPGLPGLPSGLPDFTNIFGFPNLPSLPGLPEIPRLPGLPSNFFDISSGLSGLQNLFSSGLSNLSMG